MKIKLLPDYPYLYETHMHTNVGSACGRNSGAEMAAACRECGYSGAFITDHNWGGNTAIDRSLPWREWMTGFAGGYRDAKSYGDAHDMDIFFGMEAGFAGTEFLIFGLSPEWFIDHPEIREATIAEQYALVHAAGGIVSQAHPYREEHYIPEVRVFPEYADALETSNATHSSPLSQGHNNPSWDDAARELAARCGKPVTAGSDTHTTRLLGGGMAFRRRIKSAEDFCAAVLGGEDYILSDGRYWRRKDGEIMDVV
ncbi:MAG: PHP domain-containing protein [Kiritimatiellae bacterium]|nr:PHP domain-containing protein [Kiritimatiellia bacterium]